MNRIVFFIGMMGAGKTVWGKLLAEAMSLRFQDLDDEIVAAAGQSVPAVFEQHGELYFRESKPASCDLPASKQICCSLAVVALLVFSTTWLG